jgi:hypothetical protein
MERQRSQKLIERKDAALHSFESEVESLNNKVAGLSKDLSCRRVLVESGEDPMQVIKRLEAEKLTLDGELRAANLKVEGLTTRAQNLERAGKITERNHDETRELLALAEISLVKHNGEIISKDVLEKLQQIWGDLGVDRNLRENSRQEIESCIEDTCTRKLDEASALKAKTEQEIRKITQKLDSMRNALGLSVNDTPSGSTLMEYLEELRGQVKELEPQFKSGQERRGKIVKDVINLFASMDFSDDQLSTNLQTLLAQESSTQHEPLQEISTSTSGRNKRAAKMKDVEGMVNALSAAFKPNNGLSDIAEERAETEEPIHQRPTRCLHDEFLSRCEKDVSMLRVQRSQMLVKNRDMQQEASSLVAEMHLSTSDIVTLVEYSAKRRLKELPAWWIRDSAEAVARVLAGSGGSVETSETFSQHLKLVTETLGSLAEGRRLLSTALRGIVERAQKTLLDIVGREIDASEAYASFHDALFRLPPLSQELIQACISEMDALVAGVEAMTQSEIEALTVVWEASNVPSADRRRFWGEAEESMRDTEQRKESPFDEVVRLCSLDSEEWVLSAVNEATKGYRELETRLFKLDKIHHEVEKIRLRQDGKSRIISLDSEVRILNANLSDFEDLKCSKQRLLTKKSGGSVLLKEERFRKQMQGKLTSKLEQLAALLQAWNKEEGKTFDASLLSDDVRMLLDNPDQMETWVKQRTKFMPLRTVLTAPSRKRPVDKTQTVKHDPQNQSSLQSSRYKSGLTPPRKRLAPSTSAVDQSTRTGTSPSKRVPLSPSKRVPLQRPRESPLKGSARSVEVSKKRKPEVDPTTTASKVRRTTPNENNKPIPKISSKQEKTAPRKRETSTLPPFGHLLSEVSSPGPSG